MNTQLSFAIPENYILTFFLEDKNTLEYFSFEVHLDRTYKEVAYFVWFVCYESSLKEKVKYTFSHLVLFQGDKTANIILKRADFIFGAYIKQELNKFSLESKKRFLEVM
jgi:hypothetical protein